MKKIVLMVAILLSTFSLNAKFQSRSFKHLKRHFEQSNAWGLHTTLDLHGCDPERIRDRDAIEKYIIQLCDLIEMKRFGEPQIVHFGVDPKVSGFSMTQLIETSLISGHFANESNSAYIDIFSCKLYDPQTVAQFTKSFFKSQDVDLHVIMRK